VNYEGRQRFASLVKRLVKESGSRRAFAKNIGVTSSAVIGWEECRSIPDLDNLAKIAQKSGYSVEELQKMLLGKADRLKASDFDLVVKKIESMPPKQLALISRLVSDRLVALVEQ
jgi:transcriptional regulator with XRE-family HTH domain